VGTRSSATDPATIALGGGEAGFFVEVVPAGPVLTYTVQTQGRRLP